MEKIISVKNLRIVRQKKEILRGIDFEMRRDQNFAIIGKNGAGKSFFLRVLSADLVPSGGEISIFGKFFGRTNLWNLRKKIGFLSSRLIFLMENLSAIEVVFSGFFGTFGVSEKISENQKIAAEKILKKFAIADFSREFRKFSDGEKRKILLARATILQPEILIFDEPCAGLDIPTRENFLKTVDELSKKIPILYVTHHLDELPRCISDVIFLKSGKIFLRGQKEKILNSKNLSAAFDHKIEVVQKNGKFFAS